MVKDRLFWNIRNTPIIQRLLLCILLSVLSSCVQDTSDYLAIFQAKPHISAPQEFMECALLVERHVLSTRHWDEQEFKVSFEGIDEHFNNQPIFRISHIDDYKYHVEGKHGAGTSIFVVADCRNMKIIEELKMQ